MKLKLESVYNTSYLLSEGEDNCVVLFTSKGIVMIGNLAPCGGVFGDGLDFSWFLENRTEEELCRYFLHSSLNVAKFKESLQQTILSLRERRMTAKSKAREIWTALKSADRECELVDIYYLYDEFTFSIDLYRHCIEYNEIDSMLLMEIHRQFREAYKE
jgi:hypothetical protein